ncbi:MAG: branched-chain amino acid ABC transporter permease [Methanosarcinales archaeon]|nr:branched-chain amino acid ABC transporter permease [Methanosarcinales archaeon]
MQLIINGLVIGSIIALTAIGLSMIYKTLNFVNFAHGDFVAFAAYIAFFVNTSLGAHLAPAFLISILATILLGVFIEKVVWLPMRRKNATRTTLIIISIGLALVLRNILIFVWGGGTKNYNIPVRQGFRFFGATITPNQILVIITAFLLMFLLHYLLSRTKIGKAMRALSDNIDLARISGIDVDKVVLWTWVIGLGLAATGGVLYGLVTAIRPSMGWYLLLPMFAAIILGGIGNPYGTIAGGMIIGLSQELSTAVLPTEYKFAVSFVVMTAVLLVKPEGIFGGAK